MYDLPLLCTARADVIWLCQGCCLASPMWHRTWGARKAHRETKPILCHASTILQPQNEELDCLQPTSKHKHRTGPKDTSFGTACSERHSPHTCEREQRRIRSQCKEQFEVCSSKALSVRLKFSSKGSPINRAYRNEPVKLYQVRDKMQINDQQLTCALDK